MSLKNREVHTYNIALEVKKLNKSYEGNCGPKMEYAYTYFPNIISLRPGDNKIRITLTGSTPNSIGITSVGLHKEHSKTVPAVHTSLSHEIKYKEGKKSRFFVNVAEKLEKQGPENYIQFSCDPQVQNSPPIGPDSIPLSTSN